MSCLIKYKSVHPTKRKIEILTRFALFNSVVLFVLGYIGYFHNGVALLWAIDPTHVTFLILAIYVGITIYLGLFREKSNFEMVHFISNRLTSIGLIGTVIGIMILLNSIGTLDLTNIGEVVQPLFHGMSTVLITTLFGIAGWLLVDYQIAFVFGLRKNEQTD